MILNNLIHFPIWKNDGKAIVNLNELQNLQIKNFVKKVDEKEYNFVDNLCLCGNTDKSLDILVAQKDRYGISCDNVLCKKCGLIRLKDRLDDCSTAEFYKHEYRDIYVGKEQANNEFFNWIRQRSRWIKGYMQTYLVHMRDPAKLVRQVGWRGFFGFNFFIGGTSFTFLLYPILLLFFVLYLVSL